LFKRHSVAREKSGRNPLEEFVPLEVEDSQHAVFCANGHPSVSRRIPIATNAIGSSQGQGVYVLWSTLSAQVCGFSTMGLRHQRIDLHPIVPDKLLCTDGILGLRRSLAKMMQLGSGYSSCVDRRL